MATESEIRAETLKHFAALMDRKPPCNPADCADRFRLFVECPAEPLPDDMLTFRAEFAGKRKASRQAPGDALSWDLERLSAEVLKPLAKALLESA